MKDEIKEILDRFEFVKKEPNKSSYYPEDLLTREEMWLLYDCITNLDEKYKKSCETYQQVVDEFYEENENLKDKINKALNYMKNNKIGSYIELYKILGGNPMDLFKENK